MKLSRYEILVKVVELGSISKAAEYCKYTQSAVSQIISNLESEMSIALLNRSHAGITLTSDGEELFPHIRDIAHSYNRLSDKVFSMHGIESGIIRIGAYSSISCHYLPPVIKAFKEQHPNIQFVSLQGDYRKTEEWVAEGVVDFGFVALPTRKEFNAIPIISDRMLALLPEDHHMADRDRVPLTLFAEEPVIFLQHGTQKEVTEAFRLNKIKPRVEYRTEDDYAAMAMVESKLGISILAELVLHRNPYRIITKETEPPFRRNLAVATYSKRRPTLVVQRFLSLLSEMIPQGLKLE